MNSKNSFKQGFFCLSIFTLILIAKTDALGNSSKRQADNPSAEFLNKDSITTIKGNSISTVDLNKRIDELMDSIGVPGLSIAIINDAEIVYHNVSGVKNMDTKEKVTDSSLFEAASISKPPFAYFVMLQAEKGRIDLDKPLYEYFPYKDVAHDERYKKITARMILCHTSGLPNWRKNIRKDSITMSFSPGEKFSYSGEGYQYLMKVLKKIRNVDDRGLDSIFNAEIVQPIGAQHMYYCWNEYTKLNKVWGHKKNHPTDNGPQALPGVPIVFGAAFSLHTEAFDYAKFLCSIMNDEILKPETKAEMLKKHVNLPVSETKLGWSAWSLGFALENTTSGLRYIHNGSNGDFHTYCHFYKEHDIGIVLFNNCEFPIYRKLVHELLTYLGEETKF